MALDDQITQILENMQTDETENGRLILHSQPLEETLGPQSHRIRYLINCFRLQHPLAVRLEQHFSQKRDASDSTEDKKRYDRLLTAYQDFHTIRIDSLGLNVNQEYSPPMYQRYALPIACSAIFALHLISPSLRLSEMVTTAMSSAMLLVGGVYTVKQFHTQNIGHPPISLDDIRQDMKALTGRYLAAKEAWRASFKVVEATPREIVEGKVAVPSDVLAIIKSNVDSAHLDPDKKTTFSFPPDDPYDDTKVSQLKSMTDTYLQYLCPTLDLSQVTIRLPLRLIGLGSVKSKHKEVLISRQPLENSMHALCPIYAHEVGHLDGIDSEGMAEFLYLSVMTELLPELHHTLRVLRHYETLLDAVVHTYVIERKKQESIGWCGAGRLGDFVQYHATRVLHTLTGNKADPLLDTGMNRKLYDELIGMQVPPEIAASVFYTWESLSVGKVAFDLAQHVLLNNGLGSGYTLDLYRIIRQKDALPALMNVPIETDIKEL